MRRATEHSPDFSDLDALVLAEIASLGQGRIAGGAETRTNTSRNQRESAMRRSSATPRPPAGIRGDRDPRPPAGHPSGEESDGLFDGLLDPGDPHDDLTADGPTAADLLTPEEQAFVARAAGFLSGRANADLILDRIWSVVTASRPDGFYDPEAQDALAEIRPDPGADRSVQDPRREDTTGVAPKQDPARENAEACAETRPVQLVTGVRQPGKDPPPLPSQPAAHARDAAAGNPSE